ncbi:MAG TPA: IclR family transcriptional regulator [Variovorax sp.]|nr:IclR family transcriptional regulator [Variovorax sp.]
MSEAEKSDNVRAVGRALEILLAFTPQDYELSAAELLKRVDLSRPTLYRLLYTLQEHGFLASVGDPQRFRLGPAVAKLAHVWTAGIDLASIAEPVLRRIWQETSESVSLYVPRGELRTCIAELPSPHPLSFRRGVGYTEKIVRGATGRAILAFLDLSSQEIRKYLQGSGVQMKELDAELAQTRKRGYATSRSELIEGAVAVAAPFFDRSGRVAGSMGVYGPEVRLNAARQQQIARLLIDESAKLSEALGFAGVAI